MTLGADAFVVASDNVVAEAVEAVGGPPPIVIEAAGVPGVLAQAIGIVRPRGTVVLAGCCTEPETFVPAWGLLKEVRIQFADLYTAGDYHQAIQTLDTEPVGPRPMITNTIGLDALPAMFETLRGPADECKVLVDPRA